MRFLNVQKINLQSNLLKTALAAGLIGLANGVFQAGRAVATNDVTSLDFLNFQPFNFQEAYDLTVSVLVVVVPLAISWYVRTYLKSAESQKRLSMITTLANAAIHYAEDCERRGMRELTYNSLALPESMADNPSPGHQKLCLASSWLVEEVKRAGGKRVSIEEAAKWVAAEFHRNVGDLQTTHSVSALTDLAANLLNQLSYSGHITLPANKLEAASLIQAIADWATNQQTDMRDNKILQRETAMARISPHSLMTASINGNGDSNKISPEMRLTLLARQATDFVKDLQKKNRLKMSERDTAMAWLIQKVQQDDLPVTRDQIGEAIAMAFEQRPS